MKSELKNALTQNETGIKVEILVSLLFALVCMIVANIMAFTESPSEASITCMIGAAVFVAISLLKVDLLVIWEGISKMLKARAAN